MFKKILAPIRGTHEDAAALDVAFMLAGQFGGRVEALYVAPSNAASVTVDTVELKPADEVARLEGTEPHRAALILFSEALGKCIIDRAARQRSLSSFLGAARHRS